MAAATFLTPPAQVVSRSRMPRQELIVMAREGLAFVAELLLELWAFRRATRGEVGNLTTVHEHIPLHSCSHVSTSKILHSDVFQNLPNFHPCD